MTNLFSGYGLYWGVYTLAENGEDYYINSTSANYEEITLYLDISEMKVSIYTIDVIN